MEKKNEENGCFEKIKLFVKIQDFDDKRRLDPVAVKKYRIFGRSK